VNSNPNNYGSLEACQRLVAAGIVLETEKVWAFNEWIAGTDEGPYGIEEWRLISPPLTPYKQRIPAPSMVEVWRELPTFTVIEKHMGGTHEAWVIGNKRYETCLYNNPTDALIDLLIWARQKGEKK